MKIPVGFLDPRRAKRAIAKTFACGLLLGLPACSIPPLRYAEPAPPLPGGFNDANNTPSPTPPIGAVVGGFCMINPATVAVAAENSAQLTVPEFYNDPLLVGLIQQSLANNRELKQLEQEVQIAQNEILARQGAYLPFVTVGGHAGFDKSSRYTRDGAVDDQLEVRPGRRFPNPVPNYRASFDLFWTPDIWRQLRNARDAAIQRYFALSERRNYYVTTLVAEVAENYYRLIAADKRLETLDKTIALQQQSLQTAEAKKAAGRGTELAVQRFTAEVRKNQSEKLIVRQDIVEVENRTNYLLNRMPQPVARLGVEDFFNLEIHAINVGVPAQLLMNRPDIRQAERELQAAGLDILVARARFYPAGTITAGVGYEAYALKYIFNSPQALVYNLAGDLVAPLINKKAIQADYMTANARQLEAIYEYQRVILNGFVEVVNRVSRAENYRKSIEIRKQQLTALEKSVQVATQLFQNARAEYVEVLLAQRDLQDARLDLVDTKREQLGAIVNAYQALGGGDPSGPRKIVEEAVLIGGEGSAAAVRRRPVLHALQSVRDQLFGVSVTP